MRFLENGPPIPDELLLARDQGRVVFFCGAGVSRESAGLPDFIGLARKVAETLGVEADNPAITLLDEARNIEERTGVAGLIPADRVFGIFERDFLVSDIETAVATALRPGDAPDVSAHRTLVDLATTPLGDVRIVTTNFDRLFDDCGRQVRTWQRPHLPDPSRSEELNGIVYLHGKVSPGYEAAEGDGFVLSSAAFGRAYLTESWATSFFQKIIARYVVVFVGYAADDPPVQYLLEALNDQTDRRQDIYAFQSGDADDATSRWLYKGVTAIPYGDHSALWSTLSQWAVRARDPSAWHSQIIEKAKSRPTSLAAHERGQVAHVVSTVEGFRRFSGGDVPPPAEWLCVFDPCIRYATPGRTGTWREPGPPVDPFPFYCIDSDEAPGVIAPGQHPAARDVPSGVWDAYSVDSFDFSHLDVEKPSRFRGPREFSEGCLPIRLRHMKTWLAKVASQPTAVWWAARQRALHPEVCREIRRALLYSEQPTSRAVREAWLYLFEYWDQGDCNGNERWLELEKIVAADGWSDNAIRKYAAVLRPYVRATKDLWWGAPNPPDWRDEIDRHELVDLRVEYPVPPGEDIEIPDGHVAALVTEFRKNLEVSRALELEIGGWGLRHLKPIFPNDNRNSDRYDPNAGLSGHIERFVDTFDRLCAIDLNAAKQELLRWPTDDDTIFVPLRIWASRNAEVVPEEAFECVLVGLSDKAFWDAGRQRDLLLTLASRWNALSDNVRAPIERRIQNGPPRRQDEAESDFGKRRGRLILNRLTWLSRHGCQLNLDLDAATTQLREAVPEWKPEHADGATESLESEGGFVTTKTDHAALLVVPLADVLPKAQELHYRRDHFLFEHDPYLGLSNARPVRALSALVAFGRQDEYPAWAWNTFLTAEARKTDSPRLMALIGARLARCPPAATAQFLHAAAGWLLKVGNVLAGGHQRTFREVMGALIGVVERYPARAGSGLGGGATRDWVGEAINSPTGNLMEALFCDVAVREVAMGGGLPEHWVAYVERMLELAGDPYRYAVVLATNRLNWFYVTDRSWAEGNLLSVLESGDRENEAAFWSGFLLGGTTPDAALYVRLKPGLLDVARGRGGALGARSDVLPGVILAGWGSVVETGQGRYVSNEEFRELLVHADDGFRARVLWYAEKWMEAEGGAGDRWATLVVELLGVVWPRQKSVKTPTMSARLFRLALCNEARFPKLVGVVQPLLGKINRDRVVLPRLRSRKGIVERHPREVLGLLEAVLPMRVEAWPIGIGEILHGLWAANETLRLDSRLRVLRRRWEER